MKKTVKELIECLKAKRPGYARALREMAESGIMSPDAAYEEPVGEPAATEEADHEVALKAGFRGAIVAVLDDDSLDMKGKLGKIKEIMKAEEKLMGGGKDSSGDTPSADDAAKTEEARKAQQAAGTVALQERFDLRIKARDLCSDAGITPTKTLRKALDACTSEAEVRELIEEHKKDSGSSQTPKSAGNGSWVDTQGAGIPVRESLNGGAPVKTEEQRKNRLAELRSMR